MTQFDYIVVGTGATGSIAAKELVDAGASVLLIDGGLREDRYAGLIPPKNFLEIRYKEADQYRYFLGDDFESAAYRNAGVGAQLTPPRRHIVERTAEFLPVRCEGFEHIESLAFGGLAGGWGLMCNVYSDAELTLAGLPRAETRTAYQSVSDAIGICGEADDAVRFTSGELERIAPAFPLNPATAVLAAKYERLRAKLNAQRYFLGRPALALLTQAKDDRRATQLRDMDFYDDAERAAWRPDYLVQSLLRHPNAAYEGRVVVTRFEEREGGIDVAALDIDQRTERRFSCRRLVLACGALGSARIVLRSLSAGLDARLPLLCNDYTYVPCIVPSCVGKDMPKKHTGLAQLSIFHDRNGDGTEISLATIFTYRSLMLFPLLREMPLGVSDARRLMQFLLSGFVIAGIDHPQSRSPLKELWLKQDETSPTRDALRIEYQLTTEERHAHEARERSFMHVLRRLGAWPIKRVHPALGSSIHYAGTLPFADRDESFTLARDGRLHGTRNVYVADGSGFTYLPAKGPALSLMANAQRIARGLTR